MTWVMVVCKQSDELAMAEIISNILKRSRKEMRLFYGAKRLGNLLFMVFHDPKESMKIAEGLIVRRYNTFDQIPYLLIDRNGFL